MMRRFTLVLLFACLFVAEGFAALNGSYTINPTLAASPTNYLTFASAVSDMVSGTRADGGTPNGPNVSGPVIFDVAAGTFNERVLLPAIGGASASNTITFNGAGAGATVLTWNSTTANDYTWLLNGADFIRIQHMEVENTGPSYGNGIQLISSADNNIISNCLITLPPTSTSLYHCGIISGSYYTTLGVNGNNLIVQNNTIVGGRIGIVVNGASATLAQGTVIENNVINESYFAGIYVQYLTGAQINRNTIAPRTGYVSSYGSQVRNSNAFTFSRNRITQPGLYGAYFLNANASTSVPSLISNNMIGGGFQTTSTAYGMYFSGSDHIRVYHNSVHVDNPGTTARGLYVTGSAAGVEILNNAFSAAPSNGTSGIAAYVSSVSGLVSMDYNRYSSNGTVLVYLAANYNTLAALQAGQPGFNANSRAGWPNFVGVTDLHSFGVPLSNWATPIAGINVDIDGDTRPLAPDLIPDVGADEFLIPPYDPDVLQITGPVVLAMGPNTVQFVLENNGGQSLNGQSITLEYSTDGGTTWVGSQTFVPTNLGGPADQEAFSFAAPWVVSTPGTYTFCVRISPAFPGDPDAVNQICANACTGLGGNYTINNTLPTGGLNYNNFTDAVAALMSCGVSGPVVFDVAAGSYTESIVIGEVPGSSALNTVTFDGGSAALVNLNFSSSTTNSAIVTLDSADYIRFKHLTVQPTGTYGFCFHLKNGADYNLIDSCALLLDTTSTSAYQIGVLLAGNTYTTYQLSGNHNVVSNTRIRGGYYGVRFNGASTTSYTTGNRVLNCVLEEFYYYGVYSIYQNAPEMSGNRVRGRTTGNFVTTSYGLYLSYADSSFRLVGNRIYDVGSYGIYVSNGNRNNTGRGLISNNMVGAGFLTTGTAYGLYLTSSKDIDIRHNSFHTGTWTGNAAYLLGSPPTSDSLRLVNNIFSSGGASLSFGGTALRVANAGAVQQLNYNLYYAPSGTLADFGGSTYPTLAAFQAAWPVHNANSVSGVPGFISDTDLHIVCSPFDNLGTPVGVTEDFDGDLRSSSTPDIGADEYIAANISVSLGNDTAHCGRYTLYADTAAFELFFWDGLQSNSHYIYIDSTGTHTLMVVDSNNCRATDSILVTILDFPTAAYAGDTVSLCSSDSLDAGNPGYSFLWSTGDTSQVIYPNASGVYTVDVTSQDGCTLTDTVTLRLHPDVSVNLGADTAFCAGGSYLLDAGAGTWGTIYQWNFGASSQVVLVSGAGLYAVTVTSPFGCVGSDSAFINILASPVANLGPDRYACDQFTLDPGATSGASYVWNTGATSQTISNNVGGLYSVTVTAQNGCVSTDQVLISMGTSPVVSLGSDVYVCDGQMVTLNAGNTGFNYAWSTGEGTQTIVVSQPGTYVVTVTDPVSQCTGSDQISLIGSNLNVNLGADLNLCVGDQALLDAGPGGTGYLWNTGDLGQYLPVLQSGLYSVQVTNALGCVSKDSIQVTIHPRPVAAFTGPTNIPLFQPLQFIDNSPSGVTSWHWDFGDGLSSSQQSPWYSYQGMGTFNVCLTVSNGTCDSTVCSQVVVGPPVEIADAYLSQYVQVFPNPGDGLFQVAFDLPRGLDLQMEVYNLSGQLVLARELRGVRGQTEEVDLRMQASGAYFLRIHSKQGHHVVTKLVKE